MHWYDEGSSPSYTFVVYNGGEGRNEINALYNVYKSIAESWAF